jgi:hypothetical protein
MIHVAFVPKLESSLPQEHRPHARTRIPVHRLLQDPMQTRPILFPRLAAFYMMHTAFATFHGDFALYSPIATPVKSTQKLYWGGSPSVKHIFSQKPVLRRILYIYHDLHKN